MLSGHDLIYLGPEKWAGLWRNRHWLMSLFARTNRVLYVEPPLYLRRTAADWRRGSLSLSPWKWQPTIEISPGLHIFRQPPFLPITGAPALGTLTSALRQRLAREAARRLDMRNPIVWISRPDVAALAGTFNARLTIYHVVDEYSGYPGKSAEERARVRAAELPVLRSADLVIVTSQALLEAKRPYNPRVFLVPNGVNLAGYQRHRRRGAPEPSELVGIPHPRLGVIGLLGAMIDFELLETLASAKPAWSLVLVGAAGNQGARESLARLQRLPNVHYLGLVSASRVPEFVCSFDVGLLPYAQTGHLPFIDPLKLYDYLAAGLPVASITMQALDNYRDLVYVGNGPADFLAAAEAAVWDKSPQRVAARQRLAAEQAWERRAEAISDLIRAALLESVSMNAMTGRAECEADSTEAQSVERVTNDLTELHSHGPD